MENGFLVLLFVLVLTACQPAAMTNTPIVGSTPMGTATTTLLSMPTPIAYPTSILSPYYGKPQPAKAIINGQIYDSGVGTYKWIVEEESGGIMHMDVGDAFAIITPANPIDVKSPFSITLILPIPIGPTELWYCFFAVSEKDGTYQGQFARWYPSDEEQILLPLQSRQDITLSPAAGAYVLEVHAGWGGPNQHPELSADYGFLIKVAELL